MLASKHILIPYFSCIPKLINGVYFKITWLMTNQSQMNYFFNIFPLYSQTWFRKTEYIVVMTKQASTKIVNFMNHRPENCFVCLFVWGFSSHSTFFHSCGDVNMTGEGLEISNFFTFTTKVFCGWDSNTPQSACSRTL